LPAVLCAERAVQKPSLGACVLNRFAAGLKPGVGKRKCTVNRVGLHSQESRKLRGPFSSGGAEVPTNLLKDEGGFLQSLLTLLECGPSEENVTSRDGVGSTVVAHSARDLAGRSAG